MPALAVITTTKITDILTTNIGLDMDGDDKDAALSILEALLDIVKAHADEANKVLVTDNKALKAQLKTLKGKKTLLTPTKKTKKEKKVKKADGEKRPPTFYQTFSGIALQRMHTICTDGMLSPELATTDTIKGELAITGKYFHADVNNAKTSTSRFKEHVDVLNDALKSYSVDLTTDESYTVQACDLFKALAGLEIENMKTGKSNLMARTSLAWGLLTDSKEKDQSHTQAFIDENPKITEAAKAEAEADEAE